MMYPKPKPKIRMKIDTLDTLFSKVVRYRDNWTCQRCGRHFPEGSPTLTNSHFFGRGMKSVRYDLENCDALCYPGCHLYWQNQDREGYRTFKINQLGQQVFNLLDLRAHTAKKPDKKLLMIIYKKLLPEYIEAYKRTSDRLPFEQRY